MNRSATYIANVIRQWDPRGREWWYTPQQETPRWYPNNLTAPPWDEDDEEFCQMMGDGVLVYVRRSLTYGTHAPVVIPVPEPIRVKEMPLSALLPHKADDTARSPRVRILAFEDWRREVYGIPGERSR